MTEIINIIALDVGNMRVGVALTNTIARLPAPLTTLTRDEDFWDNLEVLLSENDARIVVVGLPRDINGNETEQTALTRKFAEEMRIRLGVEAIFQDEALTSIKAEQALRQKKKAFEKKDIDALAAVYILEDYLSIKGDS